MIYDTRWVFTRKRLDAESAQLDAETRANMKGKAKGRLVLRGDQQTFDEIDDEEFEDLFEPTYPADAFQEYGSIPDGDPEDQTEGADAAGAAEGADAAGAGKTKVGGLFAAFMAMSFKFFACLSQTVQNTYRQLFSPVMTSTVMFLLLAVACANGESIFIADVKGAFLYALLLPDERVYARPPKGYENHPVFNGKIMRLNKAMYGLKQAPRRWFDHLVSVLIKHGMVRTAIDPCLFVMVAGAFVVKAGTHVDDFIFTTNDPDAFSRWFGEVSKELKISSSAEITDAGVDYMSLIITYEVARGLLVISQRSYIEKALKMFGFENLKSAETPFAVGVKFTKEDMPADIDAERKSTFLRMIGVARWIARNSCPEATFAVAHLSCFMASPSKAMMTALVRVFRYFKWTIEQDIDATRFDMGNVNATPPGFSVTVGRTQRARH